MNQSANQVDEENNSVRAPIP